MSGHLPRGWGWVAKLPGSANTRGFLAASIVMTIVCMPKLLGGKKKAGHGLLDSEMPSDVRESKEGKCLELKYHP